MDATVFLIFAIAGWAYAYDRVEARPHSKPGSGTMGLSPIKRRSARQNRRVTR